MGNTTPLPPIIVADEPFLPTWIYRFRDNEIQNIREGTFRDFATDINRKFARLDTLNTNQVRGALFRVPYVVLVNGHPTVPTALIPARFRIRGMDVRAVSGTDQTSTAAGVRADPIDFRLLPDSAGPVDALVDEQAATTATMKCTWVRTSGSEAEKLASIDWLELEDQDYKAGDVRKFLFPNGAIRLVMWRADSVGNVHPAPTGLDSDPIYAPLALPTANAAYDDSALQAKVAALTTRLALLEQSGGAVTNYLQISSENGQRVAEIPVLSPVALLEEIFDLNVIGVDYQLDLNTRGPVANRIFGTPSRTKAQLLDLLAALTPPDYAAGVKLYARSIVSSVPDPAVLILKFQYA